ncbi:MAG: GAF domain-containing protein [Bacteroidales bacterium]
MIKRNSILLPALIYVIVLLGLLVMIAFYRDTEGKILLFLVSGAIILLLSGVLCFFFFIYLPLSGLKEKMNSISRAEPVKREKNYEVFEFKQMALALQRHLKRLNEITYIASDLSKGKIEDNFKAMGEQDAIGHAILKLKEGIIRSKKDALERRRLDEQQNWASSGLARFGEILRDFEQNLGDSTNTFIRELVKYVDVEAGGFFLMKRSNEGNQVLQLTGFYAFDREKQLSKNYLPGEGLVGRCAVEKLSILITDVPADYIRIRSGMGEDYPSTLLLVPVMFDDEVAGVIELASFGEIEQYKIDFLESLGKSAAAVISKLQISNN